jgi:8-oxo-dGTP pyrophosphatase MutT (NUDIX family)
MANCSFAITFKQDKILLVELAPIYAFAGHWNFPGGVIDDGQTIEESAVREVLEETGISIAIGERIEEFDAGKNYITLLLATYISGEITIQESEISAANWFTIEEALALPLAYNIKDTLLRLQTP